MVPAEGVPLEDRRRCAARRDRCWIGRGRASVIRAGRDGECDYDTQIERRSTMLTARELPSLSGSELDALFANAPAGEIPTGKGRGQALMATGTFASRPLIAMVRLLAWQGKEFDGPTHSLRNLISPFGVRAITADVYVDASRLDGRPCIVLDYSKTSRLAKWVRDEIREIEPGLYLGRRLRPIPTRPDSILRSSSHTSVGAARQASTEAANV